MRPDLEPLEPRDEGTWPRRVTIAGYLVGAVIVILTVLNVIDLPGLSGRSRRRTKFARDSAPAASGQTAKGDRRHLVASQSPKVSRYAQTATPPG
jgi:hypothetical protein